MNKTKLIGKAEFADWIGIKKPSVARLVSTGSLKNACVGKRIDLFHPDCISYIEKNKDKKNIQTEKYFSEWPPLLNNENDNLNDRPKIQVQNNHENYTIEEKPYNFQSPVPDDIILSKVKTNLGDVEKNVTHLLSWSLSQILDTFGTETAFNDYLKARKTMADIAEKELKILQTKGELVSVSMFQHCVIDPIDTLCIKLLTDYCKTLSKKAKNMALSGMSDLEIEQQMSKSLTTYIDQMKKKMRDRLTHIINQDEDA